MNEEVLMCKFAAQAEQAMMEDDAYSIVRLLNAVRFLRASGMDSGSLQGLAKDLGESESNVLVAMLVVACENIVERENGVGR